MDDKKKTIPAFPCFLSLLLVFSFLFSACGSGSGEKKETASPVITVEENKLDAEQTVEVIRKDLEQTQYLEGYVAPKIHQLKFEEQGKFGEYKVSVGEEVTKGQVLATIYDGECRENIAALEKQFAELTADYQYECAYIDKTVQAYEKEMEGYYAKLKDEEHPLEGEEYSAVCLELGIRDVAKKREELKKTQLSQTYELHQSHLQEQLKKEKEKLAHMSIEAPCDGVVAALYDLGEESTTQQNYYYVAVAEKDVYYLRCEYMAASYLDSMAEVKGLCNGKEYDIVYVPADPKVYMEIKSNDDTPFTHFEITAPDGDIRYGDTMLVKLVKSRKENVLVIPEITIDGDISGKYVMKQTPEGKEKVYLSLGLSTSLEREVRSGLEEGDVIYVQK